MSMKPDARLNSKLYQFYLNNISTQKLVYLYDTAMSGTTGKPWQYLACSQIDGTALKTDHLTSNL